MNRPNILILMADQLTPFMLGCYGNPLIRTPNIDRLRRQSIRFDCAYSPNPLCAPARACFMTGLSSDKLGCFDNSESFCSDIPTFAHCLEASGYDVALSGKMHFIGPDQLHGFSNRLTTDVYPSDFSWTPKFLDKERHIMQGPWGNAYNYIKPMLHPEEWNLFLNYDEETHFRAKEYLNQRMQSPESPFCLCVSYHHPHDPFLPPLRFYELYKDTDFPLPCSNPVSPTIMDNWLNYGFHRLDLYDISDSGCLIELRRCYAALVSYIDEKVGELLEILDRNNQFDDTLIVFTSDHGDMLGERGMVQKRCFYEWSVRIPLLLKLPGNKLSGTSRNDPCSLLDIAPTLTSISNSLEFPSEIDGVNLLDSQPDRVVFSEYHGEGVLWPCYMARFQNYKYIYIYDKEDRLFDLYSDPNELTDLSHDTKYSSIKEYLQAEILKKFDPQRILGHLNRSVKCRTLINLAHQNHHPNWDYLPPASGFQKYVR